MIYEQRSHTIQKLLLPARRLLLLLGFGWLSSLAHADKVHVAVAANFTAPAKAIAQRFNALGKHRAILSFGSTGKLYTQIVNGAPYGVFLAADQQRPQRAEQEGLAVAGSRFTYASGRIALYSRTPELLSNGPAVLSHPNRFNKLAIANPLLAPYGAAAVEALQQLGHYDRVKGQLVQGENIAQTYQFVATGNADLGFVALGQLTQQPANGHWVVPEHLYTPIRQDAVLLTRDQSNPAAQAFMAFLQHDDTQALIAELGYATAP